MRRDEIRADLVARLQADPTVTGLLADGAASVYDSRTTELGADEAPAINVLTQRTRWQQANAQGIPIFTRAITVIVESYAAVGQAAAEAQHVADAALAALCDRIEDAAIESLFTDPDWVAQFEDVQTVDSNVALTSDPKGRYGLARATFDLVNHVEYNPRVDPTMTLDTVAFATFPDGDTSGTPATEAEIPIEQGP